MTDRLCLMQSRGFAPTVKEGNAFKGLSSKQSRTASFVGTEIKDTSAKILQAMSGRL